MPKRTIPTNPRAPRQEAPLKTGARGYLIPLLLAAAPLAVYWQVVGFGFVNYDDPEYVTGNPNVRAGLTGAGALWAFSSFHMGHWHPLTWLSLMLDAGIGGADPGVFHLTNLILHTANTVLLFLALRRMTRLPGRSAFVAALFAVHPLHVESVAWITERKDVLSALFWTLGMLAYARYAEAPSRGRYLPVIMAFALGLMSKPMVVTLPLVLLLLDYWPLGRFAAPGGTKALGRLVREKAPLFVLAAGSCLVTYLAQTRAGTLGTLVVYPLPVRAANALWAYAGYLGKVFWPKGLAVFYPHPGAAVPALGVAASALLLVSVSTLVLRFGPKRPYLLVGWGWYVLTLIPVIGLVQVGEQAMADRYTYLPLIGIFIVLAWGIPDLLEARAMLPTEGGAGPRSKPRHRAYLPAAATTAVLVLMVLAFAQVQNWRSSAALFEHALEVTDRNSIAHNNLGSTLQDQGSIDQAVAHYHEALRLEPLYPDAHSNLAGALISQRKTDEAIAHCRQALAVAPRHPGALTNLGTALMFQGKLDEAIGRFSEALRIDPYQIDAHNNLGIVLAERGKLNEAIWHFSEVLRISPGDEKARSNLATANGGARGQGSSTRKQ